MKTYLRMICLALACFSIVQSRVVAQDPPAPSLNDDLGLNWYGSYHGADIDSVNLLNGNLSLHIPVVSYPQRGGQLGVSFSVGYNGKAMQIQTFCDPFYGCSTQWVDAGKGATIGPHWSYDQAITVLPTATKDNQNHLAYYASLIFGDGSTHRMGQTAGAFWGPTFTNKQYETTDWTGFRLVVDGSGNRTITSPSGVITNPSPGSNVVQEDLNGNVITSNTSGLVDTMGRQIPVGAVASDTSGCPQGGSLLPVASATTWTGPGYATGSFQVKFCYVNLTVHIPDSTYYADFEGTWQRTPIQSIVLLANNTAWTFEYNDRDPGDPASVNYGSVTKIRLPTGGSISYTYITTQRTKVHDTGSRSVVSRTADANDGSGGHTWTYTYAASPSLDITVTDPLGNDTVHSFGQPGLVKHYQGPKAANILLMTTSPNLDSGFPTYGQTTWPGGKVRQTTRTYDSGFTWFDNAGNHTSPYGIVTAVTDYDYGSGAPGSVLRQINATYSWQSGANVVNYLNANILKLPTSVVVTDGTNKCSETDYAYDDASRLFTPSPPLGSSQQHLSAPNSVRGNLSSTARWLSSAPCQAGATGSMVNAYANVYDTGMVYQQIDPLSHTTTYSYSSTYVGALTTQLQNAALQNTNYAYDFNTGRVTSVTDPNLQITTKSHDIMGRLTGVGYPDGGSTSYCYTDTGGATCTQSGPPYAVVAKQAISSSLTKTSTTVFDGLSRLFQSQLNSDPSGTTYTQTTYDALGRKSQVYNPTRCSPPTTNCSSETTWGYTTYNYEALNRVTSVAEPDGSTVSTNYAAFPCTTSTDEAGKSRKSCVDGLGRLTGVWEDPSGVNYETDYQYNALDDLVQVTQKGSNSANARTRTFAYDSLSRLTTTTNPESGTISYTYDLNGNLSSKVAPKAGQTGTAKVTTNYSYDVLNRLVQKSYVNLGTSASKYGYDGATLSACGQNPPPLASATNLIGRRSAMCAGVSGSSWSYDPMGRPLFEKRTNKGTPPAKTYTVGYTYNWDGSLNTLTYPSGDVVTYNVGGAGRATQLSDASNNYVSYAGNSAAYTAGGALASMTNGHTTTFAGIVTSNLYNDRLQPTLLSAAVGSSPILSLCYDFHLGVAVNSPPCSFGGYTSGNNGNVFRVLNNIDSTRSTAFTYDPLNRIAQANTITTTGANCWGEVYTIDAWSNLTNRAGVSGMTGCGTEPLNAGPASAKNQLSTLTYDAAGNVTNDGNGNLPTYDAENRIVTDAGVTYSYDADGFRMEKSPGTMYWPGPSGTLTETDLTGAINAEYIYFNGARIARVDRPSSAVHYYFSDHLGSASVITDASGNVQQRYFFYPYGGLVASIGSDPNHYKFTGKERDSESGLDNFGARYNASSMGRWMLPDAINITDARVLNPANTLNKYIYGGNNPLKYVDPDGRDITLFYYPATLLSKLAGIEEREWWKSGHFLASV